MYPRVKACSAAEDGAVAKVALRPLDARHRAPAVQLKSADGVTRAGPVAEEQVQVLNLKNMGDKFL
jgi:hypothetical protein